MKKVINGSLYSTETARELGEWRTDGISRGDFNYMCETLYRTKSGKYFIYGIGGAMTKYAQACGNNSWSGSEKIFPMSPMSARDWAEEKLTTEEYVKAFGEPEEASDTKAILNISISQELKTRLIKMREETGKSISQIIEERFVE